MTSLLQEDKQTPTPPTEAPTEELLADTQEPQQQSSSIQLNMNHNIRDNMEEETLPPSDRKKERKKVYLSSSRNKHGYKDNNRHISMFILRWHLSC